MVRMVVRIVVRMVVGIAVGMVERLVVRMVVRIVPNESRALRSLCRAVDAATAFSEISTPRVVRGTNDGEPAVYIKHHCSRVRRDQTRPDHCSRVRRDQTRPDHCSRVRRDQTRPDHCLREASACLSGSPIAALFYFKINILQWEIGFLQ